LFHLGGRIDSDVVYTIVFYLQSVIYARQKGPKSSGFLKIVIIGIVEVSSSQVESFCTINDVGKCLATCVFQYCHQATHIFSQDILDVNTPIDIGKKHARNSLVLPIVVKDGDIQVRDWAIFIIITVLPPIQKEVQKRHSSGNLRICLVGEVEGSANDRLLVL